MQLSATLEGTPAALEVNTAGNVNDFRRFDISRGEPLRLSAKCSSKFSSVDRTLRDLSCQMPFQQGFLQVEGGLIAIQPLPYDLRLTLNQIPANAIIALLRHGKRDLPGDLSADGVVNGSFSGHRGANDAPGNWSGSGTGKGVVLRSATLGRDLEVRHPYASLPRRRHARRPWRIPPLLPRARHPPTPATGWFSIPLLFL